LQPLCIIKKEDESLPMNSLQANALSKLPDIEPGKTQDVFADFMD